MRVFTAGDALAAGATPGEVRYRLKTGAWAPVVGRGLRLASDAPGPLTDALGVWVTWPDAVLARESALRLLLRPGPAELRARPVHVWVPTPRRSFGGLVAHRFALPPDETCWRRAGRVCTVERAAVDALAGMDGDAADSLLVWLLTRQVIERRHLTDRLLQHPGAWGNNQLRRLLDDTRSGALSVAERRLHTLLHDAGIGGWQANVTVRDRDGVIGAADVLFEAERLVVEVDGRAFHGPERFQADRERRNRLVLAGYRVLHVTWHDLTRRPDDLLRRITALLGP